MPLSILQVRIIRVIFERNLAGRVEQLNILLTELGSYVEFSITSSETKSHEESDLQCNFPHFRNYMRKFYHKIFFMILILRALDLF